MRPHRRTPLASVLSGPGRTFVTQHGAQLLSKLGRVLVSVGLNGMLHGYIQHLFFVSRDRDIASIFGWEPTAIDDFASGHN
jgi:hypothetical protein